MSAAAEPVLPQAGGQPDGGGLVWVALGFALVATLVLLFVPLVEDLVGPVVNGGDVAPVDVKRVTIPESKSWWIALPLLLPVAVTALPLLARRRRAELPLRFGAAALLGALVAVAEGSIGPFYLPSALAMAIAAFMGRAARRARAS